MPSVKSRYIFKKSKLDSWFPIFRYFSHGFIILLLWYGQTSCSVLNQLLTTEQAKDMVEWQGWTDQEKIKHFQIMSLGVFGLSEAGQILFYPYDQDRAFEDTNLLNVDDIQDFWVEEEQVTEKMFLLSSLFQPTKEYADQQIKQSQQETDRKIKEEQKTLGKTKVSHQKKNISDSTKVNPVELEIKKKELEIEEEELEIEEEELEIEEEPTPHSAQADTDIDLSELEINQAKQKLAPKAHAVYHVYIATKKGVLGRSFIFARGWHLLNSNSTWLNLSPLKIIQFQQRRAGGAWWGGPSGYGFLKQGKFVSNNHKIKVKTISSSQNKLAIMTNSDELFSANNKGELTNLTGGCLGPILSFHTQRSSGDLLVFCGGGEKQVYLRQEGKWLSFTAQLPAPKAGIIHSFENGWIYQARDQWYWVHPHHPSTQMKRGITIESDEDKTKKLSVSILKFRKPKKVKFTQISLWKTNKYLEQTELISQSTLAASNTSSKNIGDFIVTAENFQGLHFWQKQDNQHLEKGFHLRTGTLSAQVIHRPFSLTAEGELYTITHQGALLGDGKTWKKLSPPAKSGQVLTLVDCGGKKLWITSRKHSSEISVSSQNVDKTSTSFKRTLEIWSDKEKKLLKIMDWSSQSFRYGFPSLGEAHCDSSGYIYANLFWGALPRNLGVGLLIIDSKAGKQMVWERKQGYDGEEALAETPLLPHSIFNAIEIGRDQRVYIATNSGLALVDVQAKTKQEQLTLYDEAYGWSTELINDILIEKKANNNQDERIWLATPVGLSELIDDKLRLKIKGIPTALAREVGSDSLWVAFADKIWIAQGDKRKDWRKLDPNGLPKLGITLHMFPLAQGGVWLISSEGVFFTKEKL